jgi:DNA-binding MarR family transcriptional regulator
MQQLQNASDSGVEEASAMALAREILDAVPRATFIIRETAYRHRTKSVSFPQLRVLAIVSKVPCADLSSIARQLSLSLSASSRLVEHLVEKKLLQRKVSKDNRRKIELTLTAAGKRTLAKTNKAVERELAACLDTLPAEARETLMTAMSMLRQMCSAACAHHE